MPSHPPRPATDDPGDLGFAPAEKMVPWLSPGQLLGTALRVVLSEVFGAYSDKREIQASLEEFPPRPYTDEPELWIDYVADLGDAFGPTYTLATLLATETLDVAGPDGANHATQRGRVLVMGGDQVYPTASIRDYENKTVGPYRAALPFVDGRHPHLYVIPGNHDWYDGLTGFMRMFCRRQWVGGWQTQQTRSYFALELPRRWWLWGIDVQFDSYVDEPQFQYFDRVAGPAMEAGDSVILCTPTPSWVYSNMDGRHEAYVTVDYLQRKVIEERGAEVRLALTGDAHHYARYAQTDAPDPASQPPQKVTAGGGGAFLSATHHLPETLELPPTESRDPGKSQPPTHWRLERAYPSKADSLRLRWRALALPTLNKSLWAFIGVLYFVYAWMAESALRTGSESFSRVVGRLSYGDALWALARSPLAVLLTLGLARGLVGFTKAKDPAKKWGLGLAHAAVHLVAIVVVVATAALVASGVGLRGAALVVVFVVIVGVVGGLVGCCLMAAYLLVADRFGLNDNELFAAQRNRDYKNFVRIHLGPDGALTVYPFGIARTPRQWGLRRGGVEADPWFEPVDGPVTAHLIEAPFRVDPAAAPAPAPTAVPATAAARKRSQANAPRTVT